MMGFSAAIFAGRPEFGNFTDALGMAVGLEKYAGRLPAILFALALLDACIIGAAAVSLATAYAIGDVLSLRHSLHRKPHDAKGFFGVYFGLIVLAATLGALAPISNFYAPGSNLDAATQIGVLTCCPSSPLRP